MMLLASFAIIAVFPTALGITILPRSVWAEYVPYPAIKDLATNPPQPSDNTDWNPVAGVFIHYRGSTFLASNYENEEECKGDIADVFMDHVQGDKFNGDIAYNFLVCPHGNIYTGRGFERGEANHAGYIDGYGRNAGFYSICGLLNPDQIPSEAMVRTIRDLISYLRNDAPRLTGSRIVPHSHDYETDCPGYLQMYAFPGSTMDPSVPWSGLGDIKVYDGQKYSNSRYYSRAVGYVNCTENGRTGWATVLSLTQGLQFELGISPTVRNFGSGTFAAIQARNKIPFLETSSYIIQLYNAALWCKGYLGSQLGGLWDGNSEASLSQLYTDAGLGAVTSRTKLWPHICRALFRMDQFRKIPQGSATTREIQQRLNKVYVADVGIPAMILVPCDGWYSRDVQAGFVMAVQYEIGIALASINGNFGPGTQAALRGKGSLPLTGNLRYLFRSACYFNSPTFSGGANLIAFQRFSQIPVTGTNDYTTWAQLLVSMGDADRPATGCDCITEITTARGTALKAAGYQIVGRYLDEDVPPTSSNYLGKALKPTEPQTILNSGLRFFPIFQYYGRDLSSFTYDSGRSHGAIAHDRAAGYRIPANTCIYFAVDYDALDEDIDTNILPYFRGVRDALQTKGGRYGYCVYGSRNVCARVSKEVGATWSFVSGMSWGFSGNMGFPLPENWALNQIKEFTFPGAGGFGLDNDVWRLNSDMGVSRLD